MKVLRRRLDEATLDIITVMLVRNCKLTPADVEVPHWLICSPSQSAFLCFGLSQPLLPQGRPEQLGTPCSLLPCLVMLAFTEVYTVWGQGSWDIPSAGFAAWTGLPCALLPTPWNAHILGLSWAGPGVGL